MKKRSIIFHYGEIATKSGNRLFFEKALASNIRRVLAPAGVEDVRIERGCISATCGEAFDEPLVRERMKFLFGLENARISVQVEPELGAMSTAAVESVRGASGDTFKIDTRRTDKQFAKTSMEINAEVGEIVIEKTGKKVDVHDPDITCVIELGYKEARISVTEIVGPGGLPVGSQSLLAVMLSGGIDSPVASLKMQGRGATLVGIHFHSYPFTTRASLDKVKELAETIAIAQGGFEAVLIPFADVQKATVQHAPPELRVILYRRAMFRIAEAFAKSRNARALVTGESLGQVASQTVENIAAISEAVRIPILRPLIGTNKHEIMDEARVYGTYDISIRPHDDCCSLFLPPHPETRANLEKVLEAEKNIVGLTELERLALQNAETFFAPLRH